ncbi:MAG: hypothetical protein QG670_768 [Thermoproteota archaeon]|nr:hypothetical protein [Thermoproteota archaeon]
MEKELLFKERMPAQSTIKEFNQEGAKVDIAPLPGK